MTPEKLAEGMFKFHIDSNASHTGKEYVPATKWFVIDGSTAEPDVNWPGDLISEHDSLEAARVGLVAALIQYAEAEWKNP